MMNRIYFLALCLLYSVKAISQPTNPTVIFVTSAPSGSCTNGQALQAVISTGSLYSCQSGTWGQISGGGGGGGTVTSVSVVTANGVSGSVATATTTPAITLTLGAIVPTSTNGVSAATMAFMDATSSVQTQLNGKQGTLTLPLSAANGGSGVANTATLTLGTSNQNWATLGTGIVKNTTTTGALSDAASSDVISLWTGSCSSSTFLRGDGACASGGGGDTITSPNSTLTIGGTSSATTLDLAGAAGKIMAGATPALTFTPALGVDNTNTGTVQTANGSANAHTIWGSAATTSNTILGFATAPTTLHLIDCTVVSTTCTLHDSGVATANVGLTTNPLSQFAATTSAQLLATLTNATGTGFAVFSASPALTGAPTAPTQTAGDNTTDIATDAFVTTAISNAIAAVNPAVAVLAASTASLTGSYVQVGGGIGDTFTITATGAFTLDGIAINAIGQRVLLKNQSTASQNGVYTATIVGTTGVSAVFTRALDYDTPSDVNNTGSIPVQSGTVNSTTSWLLTSQVTSIGSSGSSLTYAQFSISPTTLLTASSPTAHGVMLGEGTQALGVTAAGGANFPLIGQASADPIFSTIAYPTSLVSGGILYGSSTIALSSSALLVTNVLVKGGGAGGAPTNSSITDNGTTVNTAEEITVNQTTAGSAYAANNTTAATSSTSQSSPFFPINGGTFWNNPEFGTASPPVAAASAVDCWTHQVTETNGANGASTYVISHNGSSPNCAGSPATAEVLVPYAASYGVQTNTLAQASAPVITTSGTAGSTTWTYKIVACIGAVCSQASAAGSTTTGNATLTTGNFNIITWTQVAGADYYKVYRTVVGTSPTTTGDIALVSAGATASFAGASCTSSTTCVVNDEALTGDATTAQAYNATGQVYVGTGPAVGGGTGGGMFATTGTAPTTLAASADGWYANSTTGNFDIVNGTADWGYATGVVGRTSQKSETGTADGNVLTVTPVSVVGTYRINVAISVASGTSCIVGWTATWTDSNGNAQTPAELTLFQNGTAAPALTYTTSAAGNYHGDAIVDLNNAGTNIVVKWIGGGTCSAKMSAIIERIN